eukprot:1151369-Pelagomonas_calceolata.AAC.5
MAKTMYSAHQDQHANNDGTFLTLFSTPLSLLHTHTHAHPNTHPHPTTQRTMLRTWVWPAPLGCLSALTGEAGPALQQPAAGAGIGLLRAALLH